MDDGTFAGSDESVESVIRVYREDADCIYVPRCYPIPKDPRIELQIAVVRGEPMVVQFRGALISEQKRDQVSAVEAMCEGQNGVLVAIPGKGKTVMAIAAACRFQTKTVFVVPNNVLLDQWITRITEYTNLRREQIGIVQGPKCDHNKPFIVAMLKTLAQQDFPELFKSAGAVFFDECHVLGAESFLQVLPKFPAARRIGLSATPKRKDGMDKAVSYHLGPVLYTMADQELKPTVMMLNTSFEVPEWAWKNPWNEEFALSKLFSAITKIPARNKMLSEEIAKAHAKGRCVLALSRRIEQIEDIKKRLLRLAPQARVGVLTGAVKKKDYPRIIAGSDILLATDKIGGTGLDKTELDTLVYLSPSQDIEQNSGRIERPHPTKKSPVVVDTVDRNEIFQRMAKARMRKYESRGYEIHQFRRNA